MDTKCSANVPNHSIIPLYISQRDFPFKKGRVHPTFGLIFLFPHLISPVKINKCFASPQSFVFILVIILSMFPALPLGTLQQVIIRQVISKLVMLKLVREGVAKTNYLFKEV